MTSGTTLYVAGAVQNNADGTLRNAGTVQLTGDLTNTGTLASSGTLFFSGSADQTLTPGTASLTFASTGANRLFPTQDLTVSTLLTLAGGLVRTQATGGPLVTLSLADGATLTGEQSGRYVQGRLAATRDSVSG